MDESIPHVTPATEEEITLATRYLKEMSERGYGDATNSLTTEQKEYLARSASMTFLGHLKVYQSLPTLEGIMRIAKTVTKEGLDETNGKS